MTYKAKHEILYKDEFGVARVDAGAELTKAQEKALEKSLPDLLKSKAVVQVKPDAKAAAKSGGKADGFDAPK